MTKIALLSDIHEFTPDINNVDMAFFCGDFSFRDHGDIGGEIKVWDKLREYFKILRDRGIVLVATCGNHDFLADSYKTRYIIEDCFDVFGLNQIQRYEEFIFAFFGYCHLEDWAMFAPDEKQEKMCDRLELMASVLDKPIDFLITHCPPLNVLSMFNWGSEFVERLAKNLKPRHLVCFGHVHDQYGSKVVDGIQYVNCAYVDKDYNPRYQYPVYDTETKTFDVDKCLNLEI